MEPRFNPTPDQTFELEGSGKYNFVERTAAIDRLVKAGRYVEACEARYDAFVDFAALLPDEEALPLRWEHANSRAALTVIYGSAVDHFRIGDLEMSMAQLELLSECDGEDHFESVNLLAMCYVACDEWDAYDDLTLDLSDKSGEAVVVRLWAAFRRSGGVDEQLLGLLRSRHRAYYDELCAEEHPDDDAFRRDISSDRPSPRAEAREWWLMTEPLWAEFSDFVDAVKVK